ncbi:hypothetical protein BBH88_11125 [Planococcus antarcticus DSM 14505]|uniref:Uncharacterized protein n=1 Tax=Planococcus antarcticus DSM 14505 TaxID=1185653 RepID=A0ABN4RFL6_9BACL|nr:hypothetical protein [Planococcus antarcticus]ANU10822.1 hypothetical protein BBH88_11125 [Planococcus antarcticus DSM 14505]
MYTEEWDIQEIKHLKKKKLVQDNIYMLLLFVILVYFTDSGKHALTIGTFFVFIWIMVVLTLYTLKTGRSIGTKTSKRVQKFDRNRLGEKRWKRNKIIEVVIVSVVGVGIAVLLFVTDFNSLTLDFPSYPFPFLGAWLGFNIGELVPLC